MVLNIRFRSFSALAMALLVSACAWAQDQGRDFHWSGTLAADEMVEIKNINRTISANTTGSDQVEVTAEKISRIETE
jgi:hypothetical protein